LTGIIITSTLLGAVTSVFYKKVLIILFNFLIKRKYSNIKKKGGVETVKVGGLYENIDESSIEPLDLDELLNDDIDRFIAGEESLGEESDIEKDKLFIIKFIINQIIRKLISKPYELFIVVVEPEEDVIDAIYPQGDYVLEDVDLEEALDRMLESGLDILAIPNTEKNRIIVFISRELLDILLESVKEDNGREVILIAGDNGRRIISNIIFLLKQIYKTYNKNGPKELEVYFVYKAVNRLVEEGTLKVDKQLRDMLLPSNPDLKARFLDQLEEEKSAVRKGGGTH